MQNSLSKIVLISLFIGLVPLQSKTNYTPKITDPLLETWRWTQFPEMDGKGVRCMVEDKNKTMWFGVNSGVRNYDGIEWKSYTSINGFSDEPVNTLFVSSNGSIYAGTENALFVFKNQVWKEIFHGLKTDPVKIYCINEIPDVGIFVGLNEGLLWVSDDQSFYYSNQLNDHKFIKKNISVIPVKNSNTISRKFVVNNIYVDNYTLWLAVGYVDGLSGKIVKATFSQNEGSISFSPFYNYPDESRFYNGAKIVKTPENSFYLVSNQQDQGILIFNDTSIRKLMLGQKYAENEIINDILITKDNSIWLGGLGKIYVKKHGKWNIYPPSEIPIPSGTRMLFHETASGKIWIAGKQNEVSVFDNSFKNWITYEGLNFETEDEDGVLWFISLDGSAVSKNGDHWTKYSEQDGLLDAPVRIITTSKGQLWSSGSHNGTAATAYFENGKWHRQLHPNLSWNIDFRSVKEDSKGGLWFGGQIDINQNKGQLGGAVYIADPMAKDKKFIHFNSNQTEPGAFGIAQSPDGIMWMAGVNTSVLENDTWNMIKSPEKIVKYTDYMCNDNEGNLWVGSRNYGIFIYNGVEWINYTMEDGLASNSIFYIFPESKNSTWVVTDKGISKFDGTSWTNSIFQSKITLYKEGGSIRHSGDGILWINTSSVKWNRRVARGFNDLTQREFKAVYFKRDTEAPKSYITYYEQQVYQPGNTIIRWDGVDPWSKTPREKLQYSYKLGDGEWSTFSYDTDILFTELKFGDYTFQVKARDLENNVSKKAALVHFNVAPPFYLQPAFYIPILLLSLISMFLLYRVISRGKRLRQAKRETDNILLNVQEGLLLLDRDLKIGTQYSSVLEKILQEENLAKKNIIDVIKDKIPPEEVKNTVDFLEIIFNDQHDADLIEVLNPLNEMKFHFNDNLEKYLKFRFSIVYNTNDSRKQVFVNIKDLTEQVLLTKQLAETEKEAKKQMELVMSILKVDPSALRGYIDSTQDELNEIDNGINSLNIEKVDFDLLNSVFRCAHSIKGNSDLLSLTFLADKAHVFEDKISKLKNRETFTKSDVKSLKSFSKDLRDDLKSLLDLLDKIGKLHTHLSDGDSKADHSLINSFKSLIKDTSKQYKKKIKLVHDDFHLNDIPQKKRLLVKDVIIQFVRNSIAHGIETQSERKKVGKSPTAKIELKSINSKNHFGFIVRDDGKGLQLEKLRQKAIESGKWSEKEIKNWDNKKLQELIFESGITTTETVDKLSGRGVGMDLVYQKVIKQNGSINISYEPSKYCEFEVLIPNN